MKVAEARNTRLRLPARPPIPAHSSTPSTKPANYATTFFLIYYIYLVNRKLNWRGSSAIPKPEVGGVGPIPTPYNLILFIILG